eukprot:227024_1
MTGNNMGHCLKKFLQRISTLAVCVTVVLHSFPVGVLGAATPSQEELEAAQEAERKALEAAEEALMEVLIPETKVLTEDETAANAALDALKTVLDTHPKLKIALHNVLKKANALHMGQIGGGFLAGSVAG